MKFAYTIVYISDVAASLTFFEKAFGMTRRFLHESGGYGELETGATTLSFASHETARGNLGHDYAAADASVVPLGIEVGLVTDDVAAACERALKAGAVLLKPPAVNPGARPSPTCAALTARWWSCAPRSAEARANVTACAEPSVCSSSSSSSAAGG